MLIPPESGLRQVLHLRLFGERIRRRPMRDLMLSIMRITSIQAMKDAGFKLDGITEGSTDEELTKVFVKRYRKDPEVASYYCYYNYWIRHLDNNKENEMGVMEFAIVRNNIYRLLVTNISGLGTGTPEIDPEKPDEYEAYLKMDFNVLPWIVRNQGGDGGATLK